MLPTDIDSITIADLQQLIDDSVLERRVLEYKEQLQIRSDDNKKEFLADISSFANSNGGDLIFGIREEDHYPTELVGVEIIDIDEEIRRLDSIIRDGIRPRIPFVLINPIQIQGNNYAIIIRIPKSWLNPHMVIFKNSSKFFARASNGKFQLDVDQIRSAFSLSDSKIDRIKEFVQTRLSEVISKSTPIPLTEFPKICMHIVLLSSIETPMVENFNRVSIGSISPMFRTGASPAYIADGYLSYASIREDGGSTGYVLIFRNGAVEAVSSFLSNLDREPVLPLTLLEDQIINKIKEYSKKIKILGVEPPAYVFIHLLGVKGLGLPRSGRFAGFDDCLAIQKDLIALPNFELLIYGIEYDEAECDYLTKILKLPFDALSNAVGLPRSFSYDKDGEWSRR